MRTRVPRWPGYLLIVALAGCATVPRSGGGEAAQALPPELAGYYEYRRQPLQAAVDSAEQKSGYQIQRIRLAPSNDPAFRPIRMDLYQSDRPGRLPAILMSPILAGNDLYVREFAGFYAARGMHAAIIYRPKEIFSPDRNLADIETHFRESIVQLRQALDWLETLDSVDSRRIGSFAISLGAILTVPLAAVEPRIKAHVFGLPAGHLAEVIMTSKDKTLRKRRKAYLERHGWSREEAGRQLKNVIRSEPMRFAPLIDPGKALVIVGLFDRVVGIGRSLDLWGAMGRPPLVALPTGHYTAYAATPYLKIVTYSFFRRQLRTGPE